jgi:hypothetical protein
MTWRSRRSSAITGEIARMFAVWRKPDSLTRTFLSPGIIKEIRPYLLSKFEWHDGTLKRWLEAIREIRADLQSAASQEDDISTGKGD